MKNRKKLILIIAIILVLAILGIILKIESKDTNNISKNIEAPKIENIEIDKNQIEYQENTTVEDLKSNTSSSDIYELSTEYDGRKNLKVKDSIQYKVVLIGILTKTKPDLSNINNTYEKYKIDKNGIWISNDSREDFLRILESNTKNKYEYDEEGYLIIKEKSSENNDNDKKLEELINGQNQYVIDISGEIYNLDTVSGTVELYEFEKLDSYQIYEYVQDRGDFAIVLTKNRKEKLLNSEILKELLELI